MFIKKYPLALLSTLLLTGCTSLTVKPEATHFEKKSFVQHRSNVAKITRWDIDGAFSVQQSNKVNIAHYFWQQTGNDYQIRIESSLNLYSLKILKANDKVTLWESNKKPETARSAEILMTQRLGWSLPVSFLTHWIRGLPAPLDFQASHDPYGHLTHLRQQGWQVTFTNYQTVQGHDLPRTLEITGRDLKIKIVVKKEVVS